MARQWRAVRVHDTRSHRQARSSYHRGRPLRYWGVMALAVSIVPGSPSGSRFSAFFLPFLSFVNTAFAEFAFLSSIIHQEKNNGPGLSIHSRYPFIHSLNHHYLFSFSFQIPKQTRASSVMIQNIKTRSILLCTCTIAIVQFVCGSVHAIFRSKRNCAS